MENLKTRTTWREKLEKTQAPRIVDVPPSTKMASRFGSGKMLIPKPLDVDALIRQVKRGRLVTISQIRRRLAEDFKVDFTCPLTTGIFVRIAAEAAEEDLRGRKVEITPWWRIIRDDGGLNEKFPGGGGLQATRLMEEGHNIELDRGKRGARVRDFQRYLQEF